MGAISPAQCRAARALLDWTREQLAAESGVPMRTLADFETGATTPRPTTLQKLQETFSRQGVAFISVNGSPSGVTLVR